MNVRAVNETHDPELRSFVASANDPGTNFPLQNLPFGVFRRLGSDEPWRGGVAIGDAVLDLAALRESKLFWGEAGEVLALASRAPLNDFMALGHEASHALRVALGRALAESSPASDLVATMLVPLRDAEYALPVRIGDYTDFYSSLYHATAVGHLLRPGGEALTPNYRWVPIGYHGRASSVVVSNTPISWPSGQRRPSGAGAPSFGPSERLDYEMELGLFVGRGNELGTRVAVAEAESHLFGICVLNDWSARDIQAWESQPLGPFLGKSFATTISPWIVTLEALAPFRAPLRPFDYAPVLPYLHEGLDVERAAFDIRIAATLETATMHATSVADTTGYELARANYASAYWAPAQLVAHQTSNGCNLRAGDLLGTGTISGPEPHEAGSLLELSAGGRRAIPVGSGEERRFLEDDDRVTMRAWCVREGYRTIGFGTAGGIVSQKVRS